MFVRRAIIFIGLFPVVVVALGESRLWVLALGLCGVLLPAVVWPRLGAVICASVALALAAAMLIGHVS